MTQSLRKDVCFSKTPANTSVVYAWAVNKGNISRESSAYKDCEYILVQEEGMEIPKDCLSCGGLNVTIYPEGSELVLHLLGGSRYYINNGVSLRYSYSRIVSMTIGHDVAIANRIRAVFKKVPGPVDALLKKDPFILATYPKVLWKHACAQSPDDVDKIWEILHPEEKESEISDSDIMLMYSDEHKVVCLLHRLVYEANSSSALTAVKKRFSEAGALTQSQQDKIANSLADVLEDKLRIAWKDSDVLACVVVADETTGDYRFEVFTNTDRRRLLLDKKLRTEKCDKAM